jgi:hypothetical protein
MGMTDPENCNYCKRGRMQKYLKKKAGDHWKESVMLAEKSYHLEKFHRVNQYDASLYSISKCT